MGFGKTNPNFISKNKMLHFFDDRNQCIPPFFASDQIAPLLGFLAELTQSWYWRISGAWDVQLESIDHQNR